MKPKHMDMKHMKRMLETWTVMSFCHVMRVWTSFGQMMTWRFLIILFWMSLRRPFVKRNTAHLDTWTWSTMLGGHVQITLIGNAEVMELMWTLVSG